MLPRITLKPNIARFIVPRALLLTGMCIIFYILLIVNLFLVFEKVELIYAIYSAIFLCIIIILGIIVEYVRANNWSYHFFNDKVEFHKKYGQKHKDILYNEITRVDIERNYFDRLFNTATYVLRPGMKIRFINYTNNMYFYVQKLVERSRKLQEIKHV